ncbi:hypothetical protein NQ314_004141 [Rhamnusium bicolor]|uniref:Uncharacterized protein n=1 Tax=Rhamnusium bicolor TaxID=1586634 RepID=A0AAV8ZM73_9CUCU|nr:hypothetical protein NQ314_004141 [Rhamnusium bicolor]
MLQKKNKISPIRNDILVGLVYILMLESGFVPIEQKDSCDDYSFNYQRVLKFSKARLLKNWKRDKLYCFSFVLAPF